MFKQTLPNGVHYYVVHVFELQKAGFGNICCECNQTALFGCLVPVLDDFFCLNCFEEYAIRCIHYPEDSEIEIRTEDFYESKIPVGPMNKKQMESFKKFHDYIMQKRSEKHY